MSTLQEKINQLKPYVTGIRFIDNISVVDVTLKSGWVVPKSEIILTTRDAQSPNYYVFYSEYENINIDDLLEFVKETINVNIEKEQKKEYFKDRVEELKVLFRTNTLNDLFNLKFIFNDKTLDLEVDNNESIVPIHLEINTPKKEDIGLINQALANSLEVLEPIVESTEYDEVSNFNKKMSEIELPKKDKNGKVIIEVEDFSIPNNGFCNHSSDTFCHNCMENI